MKKRLGILVETECSHKVNKGFLWEQKEATVEWQAATGAATVATICAFQRIERSFNMKTL